jgi:proline racemase
LSPGRALSRPEIWTRVLAVVSVIKAIDAHVGGTPVRLVVDGAPRPAGKTMGQKRDWMKRHGEPLRRAVMLEPRGHADLIGAMLTEPVTPGADAGILFFDAGGHPPLSGAATIAAATIAIEKGLIVRPAPRLVLETPVGTVYADARVEERRGKPRVDTVRFSGVQSYVHAGGQAVTLGSRELRVDIAFSGLHYAIVDTEAIGVPLHRSAVPDLRRLAGQIREAAKGVAVPALDGVVFTGAADDPEAHLKNITIAASGAVDRSASITGTAAVMAVLDAMGLLQDDGTFVHESLIGTLHRGRIARRTEVDGVAAIVPEIEGSAWITGETTIYVDEEDPLKDGYQF